MEDVTPAPSSITLCLRAQQLCATPGWHGGRTRPVGRGGKAQPPWQSLIFVIFIFFSPRSHCRCWEGELSPPPCRAQGCSAVPPSVSPLSPQPRGWPGAPGCPYPPPCAGSSQGAGLGSASRSSRNSLAERDARSAAPLRGCEAAPHHPVGALPLIRGRLGGENPQGSV